MYLFIPSAQFAFICADHACKFISHCLLDSFGESFSCFLSFNHIFASPTRHHGHGQEEHGHAHPLRLGEGVEARPAEPASRHGVVQEAREKHLRKNNPECVPAPKRSM